jgi:tRNA(Ile)-lysidine synthase
MQNTPDKFNQFITSEKLFSTNDHLLLAVSGGIDSVVLVELCRQAGFSFSIAHMNFKLRAEESERDAMFVEALAKRIGVNFYYNVADVSEYKTQHSVGTQEAARILRYKWFNAIVRGECSAISIVKAQRPRYIVTAHHQDDNIETSFMHFLRGTGIKGLRGMLPKQGNVLRPMLTLSRPEIAAYAALHDLQWVEDSSNASDSYTRNFVRHEILPALKKRMPSVELNMAENLSRFRDIETLYHESVQRRLATLLKHAPSKNGMPVNLLLKQPAMGSLLYEWLSPFGFSAAQTKEVAALCFSTTGRFVENELYRVLRNRDWLLLEKKQTDRPNYLIVEGAPALITIPPGVLTIEKMSGFDDANIKSSDAHLDASAVKFPIIVRRWQAGDYFYPLGLNKKKKIARFLIDLKLSRSEKDQVYVVESDRKILWVVGHRIDHRFRVTEKSGSVLHLFVT